MATGNGQQAIILVASDRQTIFETSEEESVPYSPSLEGVVVTYRIERERDIFISLWLQVHVTGPRHHLAGSLLTKHRGHDEKEIFIWVTGMVI